KDKLQVILDREELQKQLDELAKQKQDKQSQGSTSKTDNGVVTDTKGNIADNAGKVVATKVVKSNVVAPKSVTLGNARQLPQTGESQKANVTLAGAILTAIGSFFGLVALGRRKNY
ncbi:LPXTG cell wall anchor domain-containing protein, partial [Ligilactobacillus agilis]|uniref:LPXTG cell wall anchor domain-containing protein n=1 Tax=Ligilactobacillus agilis TaxID=1601 RepID=UPI001558DF29